MTHALEGLELGSPTERLGGYRVILHPGGVWEDLEPRWWELLRRFGWRAKRQQWRQVIMRGEVFRLPGASETGWTIVMREDDWIECRRNRELFENGGVQMKAGF